MERIFLDIEVYRNYFLALFMNDDLKTKRFEIFNNDDSGFDADKILQIITAKDIELGTFNGNSYDIPILTFALFNPNTAEIKRASDRIIERNVRPWTFYRDEGLKEPDINHVDIIDVAPGMVGLKLYGGRMNTKRLQELPIDPSATITPEQVPLLRGYCKNDNLLTRELFDTLSKQIELRRSMSAEYGVDLRSKSDAQIAEAVLKAEFSRLTGDLPPKTVPDYDSFFYDPPAYVRFSTPQLQSVLEVVKDAEMVLNNDTGHVIMPKEIANLKIQIGGSSYKIGIGGLHSQESETTHYTDEENILIDRDVESYYPRMMLNMNMRPGGFGAHFNTVYGKILDERLAAKHAGDKVKSDSLKIVLNGTFGKTSNKHSTLYSPDFMIRTTITGQLTILMLIEALEKRAIPVISANTDGIVIKCPRDKLKLLNSVIEKWENHTGLKTEETIYRALHSRDVNNYIAIKEDGSAKAKGVYGDVSLSKNPQNPICAEAVSRYLTDGVDIETTVRSCDDICKFLTLRTVTGGAVKDGVEIGKAVRWYYAKGDTSSIHYVKNGNTVPRSEGAKPIMDIPDIFPDDIDYCWYLEECNEILMALGVNTRPYVENIPRKNSNAWKALRDAGSIVEGKKGKWEWVK